MPKPYDTRLIMMVSQEPFETNFNQFCKLLPVVYVDGVRPDPSDFMNDGEIWWMLTAQTGQLAEPGRLLIGSIEDAKGFDGHDPNASQYQVKRDSVKHLSDKDGVEVITLPGDSIGDLRDLVSTKLELEVPFRPTPVVMLRWRAKVFGPFKASLDERPRRDERPAIQFVPAHTDMAVFEVDDTTFRSGAGRWRLDVAERVAADNYHRRLSAFCITAKHELLLGPGYEQLLAQNPRRVILEPIDRKLLRFAKQVLTNKKRQDLRQLLDELEVTGRETGGTAELVDDISKIRRFTEEQDAALNTVAKALLQSGALGQDRVKEAEENFALRHVQERTAELQAQIENNVRAKHEELKAAEAALRDAASRLQKEETQRRAAMEQELAAERDKARKALVSERDEFNKQKAELDRQQEFLQQNLERVTKELRDAGDEVVNRFLTIAPLLKSLGFANDHSPVTKSEAKDRENVNPASTQFDLPSFVTQESTAVDETMGEEVFFDRFCRLVRDSGFTYGQLDLQRFHLSVKCEDITILGGPSGTGKSSLPALYAQAVLGDQAGNHRPGCLMVNVNPSWMETRDLLGHMNTIEGRFYPAESGLFQYLIYAQEEHKARGPATGLYLACMDEMNLSQVEHYFSDFMMVLEREGAGRVIHCFSPETAGPSCSFRPWGKIFLSPAVRFVGTVNFDETTRLLSDRFLDRVNLIRLASGTLPALARSGNGSHAKAAGRMVTLSDFEKWRTDSALPTDLGSLLDQMRPLLSGMGCPLSPRVYRAICRFVSSAPPVLPVGKAFDVQVAQRIVPRVRSLITRRQIDALDGLLRLLNETSVCSFDETILLLEDIRHSASSGGWEQEE